MTTNFTSPSGTPSVGIRRTLAEFFAENGKLAVASSGGTDSAYLLYAARNSSAFSSGAVGLQCAQAPVSLEALNFCLSAARMGGKNSI